MISRTTGSSINNRPSGTKKWLRNVAVRKFFFSSASICPYFFCGICVICGYKSGFESARTSTNAFLGIPVWSMYAVSHVPAKFRVPGRAAAWT